MKLNRFSRQPYSIAAILSILAFLYCASAPAGAQEQEPGSGTRETLDLNRGWRFFKYASAADADSLIYDVRPDFSGHGDGGPADAVPTEAVGVRADRLVLKDWILPSGNGFIADPGRRHFRPEGEPGADFPFVQPDFDDASWQAVDLPHDWAVRGPFRPGHDPEAGGGMGRLPSPGVAWYRRKLDITASDAGRSVFLDVDGAMSYAMVWVNGFLAGGWPYGYSSWRLDLTPFVIPGGVNQIAIRLDNPPASSRWYPGGGLYRNVRLVKTDPVHVGHWGVVVTTPEVSAGSAVVRVAVSVDNDSKKDAEVEVLTSLYAITEAGRRTGSPAAVLQPLRTTAPAGSSVRAEGTVLLKNPRLWGPPPSQRPDRYAAVTVIRRGGKPVDEVETVFGVRSVRFDPDSGLIVNGERIPIRGVNEHHDLGALGAAFNVRAAERKLEILREMGCNAVRMAHNPPAPELLDLTDRMGFLVMDEAFDCWERKKTPLDFHLIFPDWHEPDLRAMVRRDRNHPSVVVWSAGNEVGEQYTGESGAAVARRLAAIVKEEDPTRPVTCAMNWAKPDMPLPAELDVISLNYQGEGIRQSPEFEGTDRIRCSPQYAAFHSKFPDKAVLSSETASAFGSRGVYLFPVTDGISDIVRDGRGGDTRARHVSDYGLNAVDFGASPDKVFASLDRHPFVAGEFVWTGWDHLGEPTPYYDSRSSYCGVIDLAGFPKNRFYLYQSRWRPDLAMAAILPHWNWPGREGLVTPVHVFTSGDEAELFLNGKSLGRKKKGPYEVRLRWDDAVYRPGELKAVAYRKGKKWAEDAVSTTGPAVRLKASADRAEIRADGLDLSFVTVRVTDAKGRTVPTADNGVRFSVSGPGEIVATDNGDPTDLTAFPLLERKAFGGLALAVVRTKPGEAGRITVTAESPGLDRARVVILGKKDTGAGPDR
ncbi:MAG: beta-galactosidase GalB [bacterium]|nr:beta-galactosidase GalB [bacterium]